MTQPRMSLAHSTCSFRVIKTWATLLLGLAFFASPAFAQQTGDITGQVTDAAGAGISGVSIEATGDVLPQPRTTSSNATGQYRFRLLPPGNYIVKFSFSDGSTSTRSAMVLLQQRTVVDVATGAGAEMEEIVTTGSAMMADAGQGALKNSITASTVDALPIGQEYRDLMKLIPGVQYSEEVTRGPASGASGADNIYQFDGVDVSLPIFGNLASEPSTHDIAQVSIVRGGAKAIGFNRAGGFAMNTVSKSGTDEFHGEVSYQVEDKSMRGDLDTGDNPQSFDEDRSWTTLSLGGPIVRDRLYFYTSYYNPERTRSNTENAYGPVPDFESIRDEYFGKLTFAPTDNILLDASFRSSEKEVLNDGVGSRTQASAADVAIATQDILILEGSWIISDESSLSFRYADWENETGADPVTFLNLSTTLGDSLNVNALEQMGRFSVPVLDLADPLFDNVFAQGLIDQYGYLEDGVLTGGGVVGAGNQINSQDFFRESFEIAFDHLIYAGNLTHDLHFGYKYEEVSEVLLRVSNGWGSISAPSGGFSENQQDANGNLILDSEDNPIPVPVYFQASVRQQGLDIAGGGAVSPPIDSVSELSNFEINDTIEAGDWTFNIGVLISNDALFGQGLAPNSSNPSGFELAVGEQYKMIEMDWSDMIQPRLGANWDFSDTSSVYINYARYHPPASSLARAASWDRRFADRLIDVSFAEDGTFIAADTSAGSGGKLFEEGIKPRTIDELLLGMTIDVSGDLSVRTHFRYKKGNHFWEDVPNDIYLNALPPDGYDRELIIPDLGVKMADLGGGLDRSYVIDELDGAFTKYLEFSVEAEWNRDQWFLRGNYTWSHYYGNFDNDNTSTTNDRNTFIGSSSFGDGAGRMMWNNQKGNLRGDRRHQIKAYGFYQFDWNASAGAYFVLQSGQPWTPWDNLPWADEIFEYRVTNNGLSNSTSEFLRMAEPAGSNESSSHWQMDLNYTHNFTTFGDQNLQLRVDLFNAFDNQTGYNINPYTTSSTSFEPRSFYRPRRFQVAVKYQF